MKSQQIVLLLLAVAVIALAGVAIVGLLNFVVTNFWTILAIMGVAVVLLIVLAAIQQRSNT